MEKSIQSHRRLGAVVLALGLAFGAPWASAESAVPGQTPAPVEQRMRPAEPRHHMGPMGQGGHHHPDHMGRTGPRGDYGLRGLTRLHDELKLDARQEALWVEATRGAREAHQAMRERMRSERAETRAALNQPGADLRAIVKRMDASRADARKQHEAMQERWLALYDSLSPEQKERARVFVKTMFERGGRHGMAGHHGHYGPHPQAATRAN